MKISEVINEMFKYGDSCSYCKHKDKCPQAMKCYGGDVLEPICAGVDDCSGFIDYKQYCSDCEIELENGE